MPQPMDMGAKAPTDELYAILGHFQPLKPSGRLRNLGQRLLKHSSSPKHEYENVHYSRLEGIFNSQLDAEKRMQGFMMEKQTTPVHIAPHPIPDPSAQEVVVGLQFETSAGLQSYWIVGANPTTCVETLPFGITLEQWNGY